MPGTESVTVGAVGTPHRATVSRWGAVTVLGAKNSIPVRVLDWHVAADDRWHSPESEPTVRQRRIDGTAVVETRLRVPDGDVVQRVYTVPDGGGLTVIEVENESPLPLAVAFAGTPVLTERPPSDVPVRGITLTGPATVLPIGHRSRVRVAIPHQRDLTATSAGLDAVPAWENVVRGWIRATERASRIDAPDDGVAIAVTAARCDLLLVGPIDPDTDPGGFVLDVDELVRCGESAQRWLPEVVGPVERLLRGTVSREDTGAVLDACLRIAHAAGDDRARRDVERIRTTRAESPGGDPAGPTLAEVQRSGSTGRFVRDVERFFVAESRLLPHGVPPAWRGANLDVRGVPSGPLSSLSFAIRWHGDRPAVLWEQQGDSRRLTSPIVAPDWVSAERSGEGLWPSVDAGRDRAALSLAIDDGASFG